MIPLRDPPSLVVATSMTPHELGSQIILNSGKIVEASTSVEGIHMRNPQSEEWISAYLDEELSGEERSHVEQWLRDDAEARQLLEDFRALRRQFQALRSERQTRNLTTAILSDPRLIQVAEERQRRAEGALQRAPRTGRPKYVVAVAVALTVSLVALFALLPNRQSESRSVVSRPTTGQDQPGMEAQEVERASESEVAASGTREMPEPNTATTVAAASDAASAPAEETVKPPTTQPRESVLPSAIEQARTDEASQPKAPFAPGSVNFYDLAITQSGQKSRVLEQILDEVGLQFDAAAPIQPPSERWESAFLASSFARESVVAADELVTEPLDEVILVYGHGKGKQNDLLAQALEEEPEVAVRKQFIWTSFDENGMGAEVAQLFQGPDQPLLRYQREELKLLASLGESTWRFAAAVSADEPASALYRIKLTSSWHSRSASAWPKFKSPSQTRQQRSSRSANGLLAEMAGHERGSPGRAASVQARAAQTGNRVELNSVLKQPEPQNVPGGMVPYADAARDSGDGVVGANIQVEFLLLVRYLRGNAP